MFLLFNHEPIKVRLGTRTRLSNPATAGQLEFFELRDVTKLLNLGSQCNSKITDESPIFTVRRRTTAAEVNLARGAR